MPSKPTKFGLNGAQNGHTIFVNAKAATVNVARFNSLAQLANIANVQEPGNLAILPHSVQLVISAFIVCVRREALEGPVAVGPSDRQL